MAIVAADLLSDVKRIALDAGEAILEVYKRGSFCVDEKADASPVTEADYAAHHCIADGLAALTPDIPLLSEEGGIPGFEERRQWSRYWLVDPLDGTRQFIRGIDEFTVNIALIDQGVSILGVIYAPVTGEFYFAVKGCGAYKQVAQATASQISCRAWQGGKITIAGSRSSHRKNVEIFASQFDEHEILAVGSSLKSCFVAEGRADVYVRFGPTSEWDTAAAQCIVEEAGGQLLTGMEMLPLRYNTKASLLNPSFIALGDDRHGWREMLPPAFFVHTDQC